MLRKPPRTPLFEAQFDWPDALIRLPFNSPEIARLLAELDADPEQLSRVQRSNVRNAALRHDWVLSCSRGLRGSWSPPHSRNARQGGAAESPFRADWRLGVGREVSLVRVLRSALPGECKIGLIEICVIA